MVDWDGNFLKSTVPKKKGGSVNGWEQLKALKLHNGRRFALTVREQKCYMALCNVSSFPSRNNYGYWRGFIWGESCFHVEVSTRRTGKIRVTSYFSICQNYENFQLLYGLYMAMGCIGQFEVSNPKLSNRVIKLVIQNK